MPAAKKPKKTRPPHPLREWRRANGHKLVSLGAALGMSLDQIHRIEWRRVDSITVADAFAIEEFTGGTVTARQLARLHPGRS